MLEGWGRGGGGSEVAEHTTTPDTPSRLASGLAGEDRVSRGPGPRAPRQWHSCSSNRSVYVSTIFAAVKVHLLAGLWSGRCLGGAGTAARRVPALEGTC